MAFPHQTSTPSRSPLGQRLTQGRVGGLVRAGSKELTRRVATILLEGVASLAERISVASGVEPRLGDRRGSTGSRPSPVPPPPPVDTRGEPTKSPAAPSPLAKHVRELVDRRLAVLLESHDFNASDNPVEAVHGLRVASRRLRAFVDVFRAELDAGARKRTRKPLRRITRALGALREWDVHSQQLEGRRTEARSDSERAAIEHILEVIDRRRQKERKRAQKRLEKVAFREAARLVRTTRDEVRAQLETRELATHIAKDALLNAIDAAKEATPNLHEEDEDGLHRFRITIKKLRYTLEMIEPVVGPRYSAMHTQCKRVQGLIGDHHDRAVLGRIVEKQANKLRSRRRGALVRGLETVRDQLETERLAAFEEVRRPGVIPSFDIWRENARRLPLKLNTSERARDT